MTIKNNGGIFGRNPAFNNVTVDGKLDVNGDPGLSWMDYVAWPSVDAGSVTGGSVRTHTKGGETIYRFIPEPYAATGDGFYADFTGGVLSGLITTRG
jgi:hypothetical protein